MNVIFDERVLGFDVPVDVAAVGHFLEAGHELLQHILSNLLLQHAAILLNERTEVSSVAELDHYDLTWKVAILSACCLQRRRSFARCADAAVLS